MSCFDNHVILYHIVAKFEFQFLYLLHLFISVAWQVWHINSKKYQSPKYQEMSFSPLCMISRKTFQELPHSENWRCLNDSFAGRSRRMITKVNLIDKLPTDLGNYLLCKRLILHANMEIYCSFKSFAGGTWGFSYREDRSCISQVVLLQKRHFKSRAELQVFRFRKWCWSYFVAWRHLRDADRYRLFYNLPHT